MFTTKNGFVEKPKTDKDSSEIWPSLLNAVGISGGIQMKKDVDCYSSCNQLKINKVWATKSNNGWNNEGWTNTDDPQGTGDHESYE